MFLVQQKDLLIGCENFKKKEYRKEKIMEIKRANIKELREMGLIHELNRLFLHPMGLALEDVISDNGEEKLGGIWDYRDDPEGIMFDSVSPEFINKIENETYAKMIAREKVGCNIFGTQQYTEDEI